MADDQSKTTEALALAWSLGWRVTAGILLGYYGDTWLGTTPWLALLFSLAALTSAVRSILAMQGRRSRADEGSDVP